MSTRNKLYTALFAVTVIFLGIIFFYPQKSDAKIPAYRDRRGAVALSPEWLNTKQAIEGLLAKLRENPDDTKAILQLAQAYIQEARVTGEHGFYDKATLQLLDKILKAEPANFDARCCKATVLLSQHHFAEGLEEAKQAEKLNPNSAFIYGLLCDAYVELGNYDEAVKMTDKMMSIRPDIRSYSRVSYLREIYGEVPGAIAAMKLAVASGYPGLEQTEWSRVILAGLYENAGYPDSAEFQYRVALAERPDYAYAEAGLGRIAKSRGDFKTAIAHYEKAKTVILEPAFDEELCDLYLLTGDTKKSEQASNEVIKALGPGSGDEEDEGHGHYADKELAYAYLKTGDMDKALEHAQLEFKRRPDNIDVCEMMAWVHYRRGEYAEAGKHITKAMRTGSKNPVLLCRCGLIRIKNGDPVTGTALINTAVKTNPFLEPGLKKEVLPYIVVK